MYIRAYELYAQSDKKSNTKIADSRLKSANKRKFRTVETDLNEDLLVRILIYECKKTIFTFYLFFIIIFFKLCILILYPVLP